MEKIVLIDSFAHIYRGFYALPPLNNSTGMPTNAIFAFAKMLLYLDKHLPSEFGAAVFDMGKPLKRLEIAPDYKATRPPMPEELLAQIPYTKKIAEAFGWKIAQSDNTEADDIISSLCAKFPDKKIIIVSNDKDLMQLVRDNVSMLISNKQGGFSEIDSSGVFAKFAVKPQQIIDYLSLTGDSSDNIEGVPGVGAKTAAKLLNEYHSIDNLLEHIPEIKNDKIRNALQESSERLRKNIQIIKLPSMTTFSKEVSLGELKREKPDISKAEEICKELELKSILAELNKAETEEPKKMLGGEYYEPDLFDS